jgi:hypothetical protein
MTTPTPRDVEKAKAIVDLCDSVGVGTDCLVLYKCNIQTAVAQALAAERASLPVSVERELSSSCGCDGTFRCANCIALAELLEWQKGGE